MRLMSNVYVQCAFKVRLDYLWLYKRIFFRFCQWKNFENWSSILKIKNIRYLFLRHSVLVNKYNLLLRISVRTITANIASVCLKSIPKFVFAVFFQILSLCIKCLTILLRWTHNQRLVEISHAPIVSAAGAFWQPSVLANTGWSTAKRYELFSAQLLFHLQLRQSEICCLGQW